MGSNTSKDTEAKKQFVDQSSGTHFFEIHMPTMGFGVTSFIILACVIICMYFTCRKVLGWQKRQYPHRVVYHQPESSFSPYSAPTFAAPYTRSMALQLQQMQQMQQLLDASRFQEVPLEPSKVYASPIPSSSGAPRFSTGSRHLLGGSSIPTASRKMQTSEDDGDIV